MHRGFIFPSAEIYGGFRSTYDYGPLGVNMLRNVKNAWWRAMVPVRDDVVGLDAAILGPPAVWEASGHLATFTDPLVDCKNCHERWRADKIDGVCPNCGSHDLTEARAFNLMFKTHAGPVEDEGHVAYLRPETAQGMFTNFANVLGTTRKKPPFGIAQVGKSFRNEITPQNFVFRTREFEQMEMEYFVPPDESQQWFDYWLDERMRLVPATSACPSRQAPAAPPRAERAVALLAWHGRRRVPLPLGLGRARGHRQPGRLRPHGPRRQASGVPLDYFDPQTNERYTPYVIEPAAGATRTMMAFLLAAYTRTRWGERPAPCCACTGVWPPTRWPCSRCRRRTPSSRWPARCSPRCSRTSCATTTSPRASASRYRRQDEVGTPWCVTVDFDSLEDNAVTVRDRDTTEQVRVPIDEPAGRAAPAHRRGVGKAGRAQATLRYLRTADRRQDDQQAGDPQQGGHHGARVVQHAADHQRARRVDDLGHRLVLGEPLQPAGHGAHRDEGRRGEEQREEEREDHDLGRLRVGRGQADDGEAPANA